MTKVGDRQLKLMTGRTYPGLADEIAECLGIPLAKVSLENFANGEIGCRLDESVRGTDVFVMQTHSGAINDAIVEQALMIDAAKRSSAHSITAVCPFLGYARQDRKANGREPIAARLIIDLLASAGADRIMSVDLHSGQTQGFFEGPFDHLIAMPALITYVKESIDISNLIIVSPDAGGVKTAERYASALDCDMAIIHKHRSATVKNSVEAKYLIGEVKGKNCIVVDDMIDTAGTLCAAADLLAEHGAKDIYGLATHGVLSDPAVTRIEKSAFKKVIVTNTLPVPDDQAKIEIVTIAPLIADAIRAIFAGSSVSALFDGKNQR